MSFNPRQFNSNIFLADLQNAPDDDAQLAMIATQLGLMTSYSIQLESDLAQANAQLRAIPTTAPASGRTGKVEVFADPGEFKGEINKFEEWWLKIQTYISVNPVAIPHQSYEAVVTVLSRMEGPRAGTFAAARLAQGRAYQWANLEDEITKLFRPTMKPEWALKKLWESRQGNTRSHDFADNFYKYYKEAKIGISHAVDILEKTMRPDILGYIIREEKRQPNDIVKYLNTVREVGDTLELKSFLLRQQPKGSSSSSKFTPSYSSKSHSHSHDPNAMDVDHIHHTFDDDEHDDSDHEIDAFGKGKPKKRFTGCFNCGDEGHHGKDCKKASTKCRECNWSRGDHKKSCSKFRKIRTVDETPPARKRKAHAA